MKLLSISLLYLFLTAGNAFSQKDTQEYDWEKTSQTLNIPDSLLKEDAICIYKLQEIRNRSNTNIFTILIQKVRIKILTKRGLDLYSTYSVYRPPYSRINKLDARSIKSTGQIIDFKSEDVKSLEVKTSKNNTTRNFLKLSVPGVEVGDEVEFVYVIEFDGIMEDQDIILHSEIPTLKSIFKHVSDNYYQIDYRTYNKMPPPNVDKQKAQTIYYWELNNIIGTKNNEFGILQESLPYIRYNIISLFKYDKAFMDALKTNWGVLSNMYSRMIRNDVFESTYRGVSLEGTLNKYNATHPNQTVDQKIYYLSTILNDSLKITEFDPNSASRPAMYYLKSKTMDTRTVYKFIDTYLKLNNINYFVAFSRNRYEGYLDITFAAPKTLTDIFYVIINEDKELHYLYPPTETNKFYIDELPHEISGTDAVLLMDRNGKPDISMMKIPSNDISTNLWSKKTYINVYFQKDKNEHDVLSKQTLMGDFSTNIRNEIIKTKEENEPIKEFKELLEINDKQIIDSFQIENLEKVYPYNFNYSYTAKISDLLQKLDGNNYAIQLDKILNHHLLKTSDEERILNYYCPFPYSDVERVFLKFDKEIELIDNNMLQVNTNNKTANYTLRISKIDKNVVMIESKLNMNQLKLTPAEYVELHKTNTIIQNVDMSRIMIRTL